MSATANLPPQTTSASHFGSASGSGAAIPSTDGTIAGDGKLHSTFSGDFDWGLALYLVGLACSLLWLVLSMYRAYTRRRDRPSLTAEEAERLHKEREDARQRQQALLNARLAQRTEPQGTGLRRRVRQQGVDRVDAGQPLGADPTPWEEFETHAESKGVEGTQSDANQQRDAQTARAVRLAQELALKWNEGTLPQPAPLSSFSADAVAAANAALPRHLRARTARAGAGGGNGNGNGRNQEWENLYRQQERAAQDAAYAESVAQDRARLEAERVEEERRRKAAEEEAARVAAEEAAAAEAAAAREALLAAREEAVALAISRLVAEPDEGEDGAFPVLVRLPDGNRIQRRFLPDQPMQMLVDWVHTVVDPGEVGYGLYFGFPSKLLWKLETDDPATHGGNEELSKTLQTAGVQPRDTLHLRFLDE